MGGRKWAEHRVKDSATKDMDQSECGRVFGFEIFLKNSKTGGHLRAENIAKEGQDG